MKSYTEKSVLLLILITLTVSDIVNGQRGRGHERCRFGHSGPRGRCRLLNECRPAIQELLRGYLPQLCGFEGIEPIVCCPRRSQSLKKGPRLAPDPTPPPSPPGTKSKAKCLEYANTTMTEESDFVVHIAVVGGVAASAKEFPHMAALGFGEENDIQWSCGGSLISEEFVVTAAHCLYSEKLGDVKFVRLGDLNLKSVTDDAEPQNFRVAQTISHPGYTPPSQYNDIALVKLDSPAKFTDYVKPACVQTQFELPKFPSPTATGWGRLGYLEDATDDLMKVYLSYFSNEQCRKAYANVAQRRLPNGIHNETQICAGGMYEPKDTCQGDSGGPLQIKSTDDSDQFYVIGVTSFGKGCGVANIPGVYTRVSNYVSWIEDTVWPNL